MRPSWAILEPSWTYMLKIAKKHWKINEFHLFLYILKPKGGPENQGYPGSSRSGLLFILKVSQNNFNQLEAAFRQPGDAASAFQGTLFILKETISNYNQLEATCRHQAIIPALSRVRYSPEQRKTESSFFKSVWSLPHILLRPSWSHLEAILRPSWSHLEAILRPSWPTWAHVELMLGHLGDMLGLCWGIMGS